MERMFGYSERKERKGRQAVWYWIIVRKPEKNSRCIQDLLLLHAVTNKASSSISSTFHSLPPLSLHPSPSFFYPVLPSPFHSFSISFSLRSVYEWIKNALQPLIYLQLISDNKRTSPLSPLSLSLHLCPLNSRLHLSLPVLHLFFLFLSASSHSSEECAISLSYLICWKKKNKRR